MQEANKCNAVKRDFNRLAVLSGVTALAVTLMASGALAQYPQQSLKLTASDGAMGYYFGGSVALSGNLGIVSSYGEHSYRGSVCVFDLATGTQLRKLTASDGQNYDDFGNSVAFSGNLAVVGAWEDTEGSKANCGSAYVFNVATGEQLFKLTASDGAGWDRFGSSVALSDTRAVIGAYRDDAPNSDCGSAYVFDVTTGSQLRKLTASDASSGDKFGSAVALSGNVTLIGAYNDDPKGNESGSAYIFDTTTGGQLRQLAASDGAMNDNFGCSVALSGNLAVIGANGHNGGRGAAYVFDVTTGEQLFKLTASDGAGGDRFGISVALSGNLALVGAFYDDLSATLPDAGSAYIFDVTTGEQLYKLTAADMAIGDCFGYSVALGEDGIALIGAVFDNDRGSDSGSAYVFTAVPEPATVSLVGLGVLGLWARRWRR